MNAETVLEAQTSALLRRLAREQEIRTRRLREDAEEQSRDIVRRARGEARGRVNQAVAETRREHETAIARRRAAIDTRQRRARQGTLRRLLDEAWQNLPQALQARWDDPSARQAWCESACVQARQNLLQTEDVVVTVDARWRDELAPLVTRCLPPAAGGRLRVEPVEGAGPGLCIRGGRACLDATVPGLIAARGRIAAELLAEIEREMATRGRAAS